MTGASPTGGAPSFSVVIPCYNYARYVGGAIESALMQSHAPEVVVVNDGSTDDSLAVISRRIERIKLINQTNQGAIAAYNRGFAESTGDVVIFLDADDLLEPDALARIAAVWTPSYAKVQYDLRIIDAEGRDLNRRFCHFEPRYDDARMQEAFRRTGTYRWPVTSGNAYSRWFLECMLPLRIDHGPDGALNTVAPVHGRVATIAEPLGSYRLHDANLWASDGSDWLRLPARIAHRQEEEARLREHATARGVTLPPASILDHELAFINYRLMARKLGLGYHGHDRDSTLRLAWLALRVLGRERLPARLTLGHLAWLCTLSLATPAAARELIQLRFRRHQLTQALGARLGGAIAAPRRRLAALRQAVQHGKRAA
jgi:glycosyltransferase involved in cell wall biosynthesis